MTKKKKKPIEMTQVEELLEYIKIQFPVDSFKIVINLVGDEIVFEIDSWGNVSEVSVGDKVYVMYGDSVVTNLKDTNLTEFNRYRLVKQLREIARNLTGIRSIEITKEGNTVMAYVPSNKQLIMGGGNN